MHVSFGPPCGLAHHRASRCRAARSEGVSTTTTPGMRRAGTGSTVTAAGAAGAGTTPANRCGRGTASAAYSARPSSFGRPSTRSASAIRAPGQVTERIGGREEDLLVAGAAAEMAGKLGKELSRGKRQAAAEEIRDGDDKSRCAESALERGAGGERLGHPAAALTFQDSPDGADLAAPGPREGNEATRHGNAVKQHCAGAASAFATADLHLSRG